MKLNIEWQGEAAFLAKTETGHQILMDGPPDKGGRDQGPRPMETLLTGLAGCSCFDVVYILQKSRQQISDCHLEVNAERADEVPAVFTKIHLHFVVSGLDLKESLVRNAVKLSAEKYCSASIMLTKAGVDISHSYEIKSTK